MVALIGHAALLWLAFLAVAIGNGAAREALLRPRLGEHRAQQVSTVLFCAVIAVLGTLFTRAHELTSTEAWTVGGFWAAATVAFEFGFFHYVAKKPWSELLAAYNVARGRLWPFVLLTSLLTPVVAAMG